MFKDYSNVFKHEECLNVVTGDKMDVKFDPDKIHVIAAGSDGCPHCRNFKNGTMPSVCDVKPDNVEFWFADLQSQAGIQLARTAQMDIGPIPDVMNAFKIGNNGEFIRLFDGQPGNRPPERYINELKANGLAKGWKL